MEDPQRLLVWGAGAIGGTIGAYLVQGGSDVTFVDVDADHVAAINGRGLGISGPFGDFTVTAPAFTPDTLEGQWNTILLCTKAQHTAQAAQALAHHLSPDGVVVSIQNGLNPLIINDHIPSERVLGSFVNFGADYLEPGVVHYGGRGVVVIGEQDGQLTERARQLHAILQHFEPDAILSPNVFGYLWSKLAYGALLFATAVTNDSIADALARPEDRALYTELGREVMRVALAHGVTPEAFNGFDPAAFLPDAGDAAAQASLDEMVAFNRRSAKTHSGIWRDLAVRKRTTEVDAQLGWVVHFGQQHGVPTPLNARLIQLIHEIEAGTRELGRGNLTDLRGLLQERG
ncbi:ketopantoate reductase family protein [Deinococcus arenicola]|uniref:2-dehydropantoate 2-reductase n=1 Tax=Deinococcus arenicola TaxID=2994950 RepID=A0ABU4DUS2_9DEIO|nr:2-dehydropantoate 2-reductase [Deinococcus sp. ZS9-10]MDV6376188.1 2-dehydropantoate 2-reductase [Deinococcus sp. ZS9-10]